MNRAYRSELLKLLRIGVLVVVGLVVTLALLSTSIIFVTASTGAAIAPSDQSFSATLVQLAGSNGFTRGFTGGMSVIGLLVYVVVAANMTAEYERGTLRTLLVQQPRREALLVGKLLALLTVIGAALLAALTLTVVAAAIAAHTRGIDTASWWTLDGLADAGRAYINAFLSCALFTVAATAVAVLLRSTMVAIAMGVAWLAPLEHILQQQWPRATRVFPGLIFDAVSQGGVPDASYGVALLTAAAYAAVAMGVALASFRWRDVTA